MATQADSNQARRLIAGALGDFLTHLTKLQDPLIIGGQYNATKLLTIYHDWCRTRGFDPTDPNPTAWLQLCSGGYMKATTGSPEKPLEGLQGPGRKATPKKQRPPKRPPTSLDAGNDVDLGHGYNDKPKGHKKADWEDEGEDWKEGDSDGED